LVAGATETNAAPPRPAGQAHLQYLPGLDGIRAIAVIAVLVYHAGLGLYGGYLGVESFFVLSGFLITTLLLADWREDGRISLGEFWVRRARRLLPALFLMLAGTLALTALLLPEELDRLASDTLAAIAYVTNWYLIVSGQSYFDAIERPSLLQHLWSLAIEEQFYLLWPLICAAGLRLLRVRGLLALVLVACVASALLMGLLWEPGVDPSRIYYGTDTRATGLLLGAALALLAASGLAPSQPRRRVGAALDVVALIALALLLVAFVVLHEQHPLLYRGGFSVVAIATALVIAGAIHPAARATPWLLERHPLRWIGLRSYGIYLWHWPIFMVTRPGVDLPYDGWLLQLARFGLTLAVAALSYTLVEQPIRGGALGRVWRSLRARKAGLAAETERAEDVAPALPPLNEPAPAAAPQGLYRRWSPQIAAALLVAGVLGVVTGVSGVMACSAFGGPPTPTVRAAQTSAGVVAAAATDGPEPEPGATQATSEEPPASASAEEADEGAPAAEAPPDIDPALAEELQRILDETVADGTIPGAVLTVSTADGVIWTGASGFADPQAGVAMAPETRVRIGSLSKMLTAVVVLQLVEEGTVALDAPVAEWLPDALPSGDAVTVRQLLQHTSGLYDYLEDRQFVSQAYQDPERLWRPEEMVAYAAQFPPLFLPGEPESWDYSNTNFVLLGMIVEQATGRPLNEELRERIFEPLAMRETYSVPADAVEGPQARGFSRSDDQTDVAMSFAFGTANIVTSVGDLRRFGLGLFTGQLLEPETQGLMEQFVSGKGQYDMPDLEYGLGLMRNRLPVGPGPDGEERAADASRVVGHIGGFGGFRAALWYHPESGTLLALSVNQAAIDPNLLATQVYDALLRQQGR
jgi:peptidoglycan/LPS O-acetylase OafA/YrhL/CubicO group peptidase (beta-lactamase class C family)